MIEIIHVSKAYPNQVSALSDITLSIPPGEFTFIAGPSGSGKSTLLRILFCAERPTRGRVVVHDFNLTQRGFNKIYQLRRMMGIVPQTLKLLRDRTVYENVAFPLEVNGFHRKEIQKRVFEILEKIRLREREGDPILSLSVGEQQRVAIARALAPAPPLLLADEPTGNLDAQGINDVMEIFVDYHYLGNTVIFATRDTELIQRYPYRTLLLLEGGKLKTETNGGVRLEG